MEIKKEPATEDVSTKLARLQSLKATLDASDAEISKLVPQVEAVLDSLRLGVPISVTIDETGGWPTYLTFEKVGKQWRLCIENFIDVEGNTKTEPLSDVARDKRAEVMEQFLPLILDTAVSEIEKRLVSRAKAIATARDLVEKVQKSQPAVAKPKAETSAVPLLFQAAAVATGLAAAVVAKSEVDQGRPDNAKTAVEGAKRLISQIESAKKGKR
jgi:hypothetical protein